MVSLQPEHGKDESASYPAEPDLWLLLQPELGEGDFASWPAETDFGYRFNQSMAKMSRPRGLLSLNFRLVLQPEFGEGDCAS